MQHIVRYCEFSYSSEVLKLISHLFSLKDYILVVAFSK